MSGIKFGFQFKEEEIKNDNVVDYDRTTQIPPSHITDFWCNTFNGTAVVICIFCVYSLLANIFTVGQCFLYRNFGTLNHPTLRSIRSSHTY